MIWIGKHYLCAPAWAPSHISCMALGKQIALPVSLQSQAWKSPIKTGFVSICKALIDHSWELLFILYFITEMTGFAAEIYLFSSTAEGLWNNQLT